ncbi:hypothetical protein EIN_058800 [Entamoeba invadens IP1]|uniref:hypothetical protein n=1 Tax=Entamoeba invadens IP1 TaxID=370355 RepID=UPI0002C3E85B|nr:hypothetical protein EIN_058800 [Entamoeba invadens IP1]ELP93425.1 hypothetical protein EIN_058800 [Entamoeba invadens IP1]|eukprot:XP_004260196.1 hypothetical protein EIN_058800 [Entamoeba invadens IP1]
MTTQVGRSNSEDLFKGFSKPTEANNTIPKVDNVSAQSVQKQTQLVTETVPKTEPLPSKPIIKETPKEDATNNVTQKETTGATIQRSTTPELLPQPETTETQPIIQSTDTPTRDEYDDPIPDLRNVPTLSVLLKQTYVQLLDIRNSVLKYGIVGIENEKYCRKVAWDAQSRLKLESKKDYDEVSKPGEYASEIYYYAQRANTRNDNEKFKNIYCKIANAVCNHFWRAEGRDLHGVVYVAAAFLRNIEEEIAYKCTYRFCARTTDHMREDNTWPQVFLKVLCNPHYELMLKVFRKVLTFKPHMWSYGLDTFRGKDETALLDFYMSTRPSYIIYVTAAELLLNAEACLEALEPFEVIKNAPKNVRLILNKAYELSVTSPKEVRRYIDFI